MTFERAMILVTCVLVIISGAGAGAEPSFRFHKDIDRRGAVGDELLATVLDPDVYESTRQGCPDLRIRDENGTDVPYLLQQSTQRLMEQVREGCGSEVVSLQNRDGRALEIVVKLRDKSPSADGLTVVSPLSDYEHRVKVFGSRGDGFWSPLVSDGLVFDYTRFMDVRNRDIRLPRNDYRLFKLEVDQGLDQLESPFMGLVRGLQNGGKEKPIEFAQIERRPFRIDRIDLWRLVEKQSELKPKEIRYGVAIVQIRDDPDEKVTRIEVRSRREPLTGFVLGTASRNFSRTVRVRTAVTNGVRTEWQEIGHGTVSRFQLREFRKEEPAVRFGEQRGERYQIVIENGDSPPLADPSFEAIGDVYRLVYLAGEGHRYRLYYGSDSAEFPSYDTAAVLASLGPHYEPTETGLGPESIDPGFRPTGGWRKLLNSPAVLTLAIVLMVVVLAWVLFRAGARIKKLPDGEL